MQGLGRCAASCLDSEKRWDAAASLSVDELELGCGDFKVVEQTSVADDLFDDNSLSRHKRDSRVVSSL